HGFQCRAAEMPLADEQHDVAVAREVQPEEGLFTLRPLAAGSRAHGRAGCTGVTRGLQDEVDIAVVGKREYQLKLHRLSLRSLEPRSPPEAGHRRAPGSPATTMRERSARTRQRRWSRPEWSQQRLSHSPSGAAPRSEEP